MTILVVGATGATGRLLVRELLAREQRVRVIVRSRDRLYELAPEQERLSVVEASVLELSDAELADHVRGCSAVASCLGHNLSLKGVFGRPRRLVTDATRRLCRAIEADRPEKPTKFVLMNTAGNSNRDLDERVSLAQRCVIGLLRVLVPPHVDNEQAADYLRTEIGASHAAIEWSVVRPDTLTDADRVSEYEAHPSPLRSAIFNPGSTRRINVAHFMADLITGAEAWDEWKGRMPVVYDVPD